MRTFILTLILAAFAHAEPPDEAKLRFDAGLQLYQQRKYEEAIGEFRVAFERAPRREILFAWAQAERLSGDCPSAVLLYRKFLKMDPSAAEKAAAELNLQRCRSALSTRPEEEEPPPAELPPPVAVPPAAVPSPAPASVEVVAPPPPARPWSRDPAFLGLVSVGALGLAGGASLAGASAAVENDALSAKLYQQYADKIELASTLRIAGFVCLGAGGVLAIAGVIRAAVVHRRQPRLSAATGATSF